MRELARGAFVIARRDFSATVLSKTFLLFLLAPLFPVVVGLIFGGLTVSTAARTIDHRVVAVVASAEDFAALSAARERIGSAFDRQSLVNIQRFEPEADAEAQRQRILAGTEVPVIGVLHGGLDSPRFTSGLPPGDSVLRQLQLMVDYARAAPEPAAAPIRLSVSQCPVASFTAHRPIIAQIAQGVLFVLTILLATMLLSQLIEEKSNKIIEVLAAAVPVGSIFLGKLLAMLATSLLGIAVWTSAAAAAFAMFADQGLSDLPAPAVGWTLFIPLGLVYFAMSYLLLGAVFLGIGAHASTAREVQTLSMPVTMAQIVVFAIATIAVGNPDSVEALAAAVFPLSSP
jgi:ABC-2 type transport system permease protein